jgi:hypothetical protein
MSDFFKRLFSIVIVSGLCFHFCLIFIYASPFKLKSKKLKFISWYYTYPYFHQQWSLFAPTPEKHIALYVRYKTNNNWSAWENLLQKHINQHQANVLMGNEATVLLYSNSLIYLINTLNSDKQVYTREPTDVNFQIVKHEVQNDINSQNQIPPLINFEIIITCHENSTTKTVYYKNLSL